MEVAFLVGALPRVGHCPGKTSKVWTVLLGLGGRKSYSLAHSPVDLHHIIPSTRVFATASQRFFDHSLSNSHLSQRQFDPPSKYFPRFKLPTLIRSSKGNSFGG